MAIFIFQGRYTKEAMRGMVENPEDRAEATARMVEAGGGKLLSYYVTLGEWDFIVTADLPDQATASALAMAVGAAGGIDSHIIPAMTTAEAKTAMERAKSLRAAFATPGKVTA
ncbi:MAG: GYD domain-containing protein [Geminicoccaceae bacterium]